MCTMVRQRKLLSSSRELGTLSEMDDVSKRKVLLGATKQFNEFLDFIGGASCPLLDIIYCYFVSFHKIKICIDFNCYLLSLYKMFYIVN